MKLSHLFVALIVVSAFISCKKKDEDNTPSPVLTYDSTNFRTNAVTELGLGERFETLADEMDLGASSSNTLDAAVLKSMFEAGSPSLSSITPTLFQTAMSGSGGWFEAMAAASGKTWIPAVPMVGSTGGVFAGATKAYLYDENGVQYNEVVEKVLNNASFYGHVISLTSAASYDASAADKILAIYGAQPSFVNSYDDVKHPNDHDRFTANYASRRDKNDGKGYYSNIKNGLIKLQSALKTGSGANADRDAALVAIKQNWEKAMWSSVVNYAYSASASLSKTTPSDDDKTAALHSISEAIGFMAAYKGVPQAHRIITDVQLNTCLAYLEFSLTATPETYKFITNNTPTQLAKLTDLQTTIKGIYGFSDADMVDFQTNWVKQQVR